MSSLFIELYLDEDVSVLVADFPLEGRALLAGFDQDALSLSGVEGIGCSDAHIVRRGI